MRSVEQPSHARAAETTAVKRRRLCSARSLSIGSAACGGSILWLIGAWRALLLVGLLSELFCARGPKGTTHSHRDLIGRALLGPVGHAAHRRDDLGLADPTDADFCL
jgi:hypothetical protein